MKISRFLLALALTAVAMSSCKKDDEETKSYLNGSVSIEVVGYQDMPKYVKAGQKFTFIPSGLSADGVDIAYYITRPVTNSKDTIMMEGHPGTKFTYTIPDTLATLGITITGFAVNSKDYYTSSASAVFTVVDSRLNEGSITGIKTDGFAKETVGDKSYYVADIAGTRWMRQNLSTFAKDGDGEATVGAMYMNCPAMEDVFGGYYSWEEAQTVCPAGWRLPSEADWVNLLKAAGAKSGLSALHDAEGVSGKLMAWSFFNRERMWDYWGFDLTDDFGFSALPTGYGMPAAQGCDFYGYPEYACFWTSDEHEGKGVYRYMYKNTQTVFVGAADKKGFLASVRCVK